uniref:Thymosin beta-4-like n=3 Tax=Felidae TaxID=9681 RepID=A0A8C8XHH7_PANLE
MPSTPSLHCNIRKIIPRRHLVTTTLETGLRSLVHLTASSATMSGEPNMAEIEKFGKLKLKKTESQEKNPPLSKEMIGQEKQAGKS